MTGLNDSYMSKKRTAPDTTVSEKVPRFAGWVFFFGAVINFLVVYLDETLFDRIGMSLLVFFIINAGSCYAFAAMIEKNPSEKFSIFKDWLIASLIFNLVIIGSIAAYIL